MGWPSCGHMFGIVLRPDWCVIVFACVCVCVCVCLWCEFCLHVDTCSALFCGLTGAALSVCVFMYACCVFVILMGGLHSMSQKWSCCPGTCMCTHTLHYLHKLCVSNPVFCVCAYTQYTHAAHTKSMCAHTQSKYIHTNIYIHTSDTAATTVFLCKLSGYLPTETYVDGVAGTFGTSSMASAGLVLACAIHVYMWLQWATLIAAETATALHTSAHTLVTNTHRMCPPEEEQPAGSSTVTPSMRGRVELRSVSVVRGSTIVLRNVNLQVMCVCICVFVCLLYIKIIFGGVMWLLCNKDLSLSLCCISMMYVHA
jgi:hypothetical protein